jgi:hypothetical protein
MNNKRNTFMKKTNPMLAQEIVQAILNDFTD